MVMLALVRIRHQLYRHHVLRSERLPVPVLVVGNLIVGGAGKTPTVLAVVKALTEQGHRPAIISRGYGRNDDAPLEVTAATPASDAGDEPLLLHLRCQVPVWVGRDRLAAGRGLLARHPDTTVIVSDDGLQHLALQRDLQILVFDERGVGNGWLLPAGPLREPLPAAGSTPNGIATLVIYNASKQTTRLPGSLSRSRLCGAVELAAWWLGEPATDDALTALQGRPVLAAAGLARPQRFFSMLRSAGLDIVEMALPDHHGFLSLPWPADTADVALTEKDAVKLDPSRLKGCRVWVVPLDLQLDPTAERELHRLLPATAPQQSPTSERNGQSTA